MQKFNDPSKPARSSKGDALRVANMAGGARIRYGEPGRKAELTEDHGWSQSCLREFQKGAQDHGDLCASSARRSVRGSPREVNERNAKEPLSPFYLGRIGSRLKATLIRGVLPRYGATAWYCQPGNITHWPEVGVKEIVLPASCSSGTA